MPYNPPMAEAVRRNAALVLGIGLAGMIFALAAPVMRLATGAPSPGLLHAETPVLAAIVVLACLVGGLIIACIVGRMVNAAVGLFVLGAGLFVLARRGGTVRELAFAGGVPGNLVVESLIWAVLVFGATLAVFRFAGPLRDIEPDESGRRPHWLLSKEAMVSAAAGVLVLPVVWAVAQSPMQGQVLAAVILGGMAAGLAGRLLSPHVQPILLFAAVCVFGAIGHAIGLMMPAGAELDAAVVERAVRHLNLPMPVDYAAGALIGVAMGLGWAKSFLHHEE